MMAVLLKNGLEYLLRNLSFYQESLFLVFHIWHLIFIKTRKKYFDYYILCIIIILKESKFKIYIFFKYFELEYNICSNKY